MSPESPELSPELPDFLPELPPVSPADWSEPPWPRWPRSPGPTTPGVPMAPMRARVAAVKPCRVASAVQELATMALAPLASRTETLPSETLTAEDWAETLASNTVPRTEATRCGVSTSKRFPGTMVKRTLPLLTLNRWTPAEFTPL